MSEPYPQQPPQQPYGTQPSYRYPPASPGGYPHPGFQQRGYGPPVQPKHPQAQTAMVLGIVALAGGLSCLLPILISPFAWYIGAKVRREMAAEPGRWSGKGEAQAGFVMGIIGTVLIALMIALLAVIALVATVFTGTPTTY
ncbi:MAG: DUF4190 domain-containing protein [Aeromicrobium sp.]